MQDAEQLDDPEVIPRRRGRGRMTVLVLATIGAMVVLSRILPTILRILLG